MRLSLSLFLLIFMCQGVTGQTFNYGDTLIFKTLQFPVDNTYIAKTTVGIGSSSSAGENAFWAGSQISMDGESSLTGETISSIKGFAMDYLASILDDKISTGPVVAGSTAGSFTVSLGRANYSVPITITPGTGGMQPNLALNYNSGGSNGALGQDWVLTGLSLVTRGASNLYNSAAIDGVDFDSSDKLMLDGQLLVCTGGIYGADGAVYRCESDDFTKVVSYGIAGTGPQYLKAWTKSGLIYEYGLTADSRIEASGRVDVMVWAVNKITDTKNNYMTFTYLEDNPNGDFNISRIDYTGNTATSLATYNSILFGYENRPDIFTRYIAGSKSTISKRLKTIQVKNGATLLRNYLLTYQNLNNNLSQLTMLQESDGEGICFKPTIFEWEKTTLSYAAGTLGVSAYGSSAGWNAAATPTTLADVNGDGLADIVGFGNAGVYVSLANGNGTFAAAVLKLAAFGKDQGWGFTPRMMGDIDADGMADILGIDDAGGIRVSMATGDGNFAAPVDYNGFSLLPVPVIPPLPVAPTIAVPVVPAWPIAIAPDGINCGYADPNCWPYTITLYNMYGAYLIEPYYNCKKVTFTGFTWGVILYNGTVITWQQYAEIIWTDMWNNYNAQVTYYNQQVAVYNAAWTAYNYTVTVYNDAVAAYNTYVENISKHPSRLADVNGDARLDLVHHRKDGTYVTLATATGFAIAQKAIANYGSDQGWNTETTPTNLVDVNGDGLADILGFGTDRVYTSFALGNGNFGAPMVSVGYYGSTQGFHTQTTPCQLADLNGDGLADIIGFHTDKVYTSYSKGDGTFTAPMDAMTGYSASLGWNTATTPVQVADINGDEKADILAFDTDGVYVSLGAENGTFGLPRLMLSDFNSGRGYNKPSTPTMLGEINGDGILDIVGFASTGVYTSKASYSGYNVNKIVDGFGKETSVVYKPLTDKTFYTKGTGAAYPYIDLQYADYMVSSFAVSNGIGGKTNLSFTYGGLIYHLGGKGAALAWEEMTDLGTGDKTKTSYSTDYHYPGLATLSETRLGNGTLVSKEENTGGLISLGTGINERWSGYVATAKKYSYTVGGTLVFTQTNSYTYDSFGNCTYSKEEYSDGHKTETTNTYTNDQVKWFLGRLTKSVVTKSATGATAVAKTLEFTYDANSGMLISEKVNPGNLKFQMVNTYTHDAFGNVTQSSLTGNRGWAGDETRTTTAVFDSKGRFQVSTTNALAQTETMVFDQATGKLKSRTGPNGLTTTYTYDGFGRPLTQAMADGNTTTQSYHSGTGTNGPANTVFYIKSKQTGSPEAIAYYDCLGRELRVEKAGFDGGRIFADKQYNAIGEIEKESNPYYSGSTPQWKSYAYNGLHEATSITSFTGKQSVAYNGLTTVFTNEMGQTRSLTKNCIGQLLSSTDNLGNTITYTYDAQGNNLSLTDMSGNITGMQYDINGNRTRLDDPDAGVSTSLYNAFGELYSATDNKGNVSGCEYDILGRKTKDTDPDGITTYSYDTGNKALGKLVAMSSTSGYGETHTFDNFGRPLSTTTVTPDCGTYNVSLTYDTYGRISNIVYPSGFAVTNVYNSNNYLSQVKRTSDNFVYFTANKVNALGQMETYTLGNGKQTLKTYDAIGRLTAIKSGNGTIQDLQFSYNSLGNLTSRGDLRRGLTENFTYDVLDRLQNSTVLSGSTTLESLMMTYDAMGNITYKSDVGCYTYGENGAGAHAVTSILGKGAYTYDANGNMLASPDYTATYTAANLVKQINKGDKVLRFAYSPGGSRYKQEVLTNNVLSELTCYIGGFYEKVTTLTGVREKHFIAAYGNTIAVYTKSTVPLAPDETVYLYHDHLGSVSEITKQDGTILQSFSYDAWGKRRNPLNWTAAGTLSFAPFYNRGYTNHEMLDEAGLVHMNGRVYDPTIGRFLSADPFIQEPDNSQNLNRYTYVLNSPLVNIDPSGFSWISKGLRSIGKAFKSVFNAIKRVVTQVINIVKVVVIAVVKAVAIYVITTVICVVAPYLTPVAPYIAKFVVGAVSAKIEGASWSEALKAGAFAAVTAYGNDLIGSNTWLKENPLIQKVASGAFKVAMKVAQEGGDARALYKKEAIDIIAGWIAGKIDESFTTPFDPVHAVTRGVLNGFKNVAEGKDFVQGFLSGTVEAYTQHTENLPFWQATAIKTIAGGTVSVIGGGKFANGAASGFMNVVYHKTKKMPYAQSVAYTVLAGGTTKSLTGGSFEQGAMTAWTEWGNKNNERLERDVKMFIIFREID